jgi:hypothetical protein
LIANNKMLLIFRTSHHQEEVDIDLSNRPHILSHFWDADSVVRRWFFDLYKMKGGKNEYEGNWSMTLNLQDIARLREIDNIDNRFFDSSVKHISNTVSLVLCNHAPQKPKV